MLPSAVPVSVPEPDGPAAELRDLLAEHARISAWLTRLDGLRNDTPSAVSAQVRADYLQRLQKVTAAVAERVDELRKVAQAANKRIVRARDQLPELRLRHAVGELDDAVLAQRLAVLRREATDADQERGKVVALLEEAERAVATAAAWLPGAAGSGGPAHTWTPPEMDDAFGEWEGPPTHTVPRAPTLEPTEDAAEGAEAPEPESSVDEDGLAFLESLPQTGAAAETGTSTTDRATGGPHTPRPAPATATSALACKSCRFTNDATAWYCEKCGAELG